MVIVLLRIFHRASFGNMPDPPTGQHSTAQHIVFFNVLVGGRSGCPGHGLVHEKCLILSAPKALVQWLYPPCKVPPDAYGVLSRPRPP